MATREAISTAAVHGDEAGHSLVLNFHATHDLIPWQ